MEVRKVTGVKVQVLSGVDEQEHINPDIELLYVIDRTAVVSIGKEKYELKKEDMILINANQKYAIHVPADSLLCQIGISYYDLCSNLGADQILFWCNTSLDSGFQYEELKKLIRDLLLETVEDKGINKYKQSGLSFLIVSCLLEHFRLQTVKTGQMHETSKDRRLGMIIQYIHMNYMNPISLSELADRLYLSPSSLSRFFMKETGESFVDYVKKVRLLKVAEELMYSDAPVTRIAVDNGFSNPSVMNKAFRELYQITPTDYRKMVRRENPAVSSSLCQPEQKEKLKALLGSETPDSTSDIPGFLQVQADITKRREYIRWENKLINVGAAYALTAADMQRQVLFLKEHLNIEYIRIWNIFSNRFMICKEAGQERLNFDRLDSVLDFCVNHKIKLFLDLGSRRDKAMISGGSSLYSYEEGILFSSKEEWEWMLERFLKHLLRRYGKAVIEHWIFEFTFFLNSSPYYGMEHQRGNPAEKYSSIETWKAGYSMVKNVIPEARVAGPGMLVLEDEELLETVMRNFLETGCKPDIFTVFIFPYVEYHDSEELYSRRIADFRFSRRYAAAIKQLLVKLKYPGEFYITEWSNSISNRSYIQDSCYRGNYILKNVLSTYPLVDAMGFWYASDIINIYYDSRNILNGSSGLLTKDGICKPSYYAFSFLSNMGKYLIGQDEHYLITANNEHELYILCYNMIEVSPSYYIGNEEMYEVEQLKDIFQNSEKLKLEITLKHLEDGGQYIMKQKIVNEEKGSVLNKWIEMGCEEELLPEDIQYLRQTSVPAVSILRRRADSGCLQLYLELQPHEMRWIHIIKV